MSKVKYYYDSENLAYRKIKTKKATKFGVGFLFLVASALFGFLSFVVLLNTPYFETPKDRLHAIGLWVSQNRGCSVKPQNLKNQIRQKQLKTRIQHQIWLLFSFLFFDTPDFQNRNNILLSTYFKIPYFCTS
jgi:hypothetical protein